MTMTISSNFLHGFCAQKDTRCARHPRAKKGSKHCEPHRCQTCWSSMSICRSWVALEWLTRCCCTTRARRASPSCSCRLGRRFRRSPRAWERDTFSGSPLTRGSSWRCSTERSENAAPQPLPKNAASGRACAAEHRPARACLPHLFHGWTRRRRARKCLDLSRPHRLRPPRVLGRFAGRLATDATACRVAASRITGMRARGASCSWRHRKLTSHARGQRSVPMTAKSQLGQQKRLMRRWWRLDLVHPKRRA
jgi:hypothetical protein